MNNTATTRGRCAPPPTTSLDHAAQKDFTAVPMIREVLLSLTSPWCPSSTRSSLVSLFHQFSFISFQADRDIMSRLGFDLLSHLETMRCNGMGIRNIDVRDCKKASSAALRVWEDSNFPYRCPPNSRREDKKAGLRQAISSHPPPLFQDTSTATAVYHSVET